MLTLARIALVALLLAGCAPLEEDQHVLAPPQPAATPPPIALPFPVSVPATTSIPAPVQEPAAPSRAAGPPTEAEALQKLGDAVQACGAEPERVYLALSLRVKPTGDVSEVKVQTSTVAAPGRIKCIREHLQAVPFEAFELPPKPKSSAVECHDDSDVGMLGCKPLPYDAVTVGVQGVLDPGAKVQPLAALAPAELPVELFADDLRWAREGGRPQACIAADAERGWCFVLTSCSSPNGYAGLSNPRGSEGGTPCDVVPKGKAERTTLRQALVASPPPEVVRRPRR